MSSKIINLFTKVKKKNSNSIYSMVSCSDLTPGSLDVWVDLPDAIKFDPALAPFKQMYEQQHGKQPITPETPEGDRNIFNRKIPDSPENPEIERQLHNKDVEIRLVEPMAPDDDKKKPTTRKKQLDRTLRVIKLSVLVACWVLLTVSLLMNREKTDIVLHTAVNEGEVKEYFLKSTDDNFKVAISLTGPFAESLTNESTSLQLWLHRSTKYKDEDDQDSSVWLVNLQPDEDIDFSPSASDVNTLILENPEWHKHKKVNKTELSDNLLKDGRNETQIFLRMSSTSNRTVPLTVSYQLNPLSEEDGLIYSTLLLATLYILIIFEVVNRTLAALLSSSLGVAALSLVGERPSLPELVSWLDVETLLLLFSMMLLVAIVAETGLFDYLAVVAFEVTGGRTWPLINCLCFFTAFFSTFLDNVTTVLLMTPVTIRLCEVMQLNPVPVLMSMVIFSNVGGSATPVGDPPNVIIASHPSILGANINFTSFTLHMGLGILCVCVQTYLQLRYMYRDVTTLRHSVPRDIVELRQEIGVWKRAAASLSSYSRDEDIVRRALEKKVARLQGTLGRREAGGGARDALFCSTLAQMKTKYRIRDKQLLIKSGICITFVVVVFFLHAIPELQRLSLGWTALLGALLLLLLAEREDLEPVLARVEWSTLLFFAALFVMMEVLSKLGLISWIGRLTESLISKVGEESRLAVAIMLILWVSGLASAFVDNIPLTTMMVRVVAALADGALNLPLAPLAWALSFGACLGERLSLGWTALLGALLLLLLAEREDLEPVLARVEWSTLLFFAALFVMMEVLSKLGLISWIGRLTESLISKVGEESRLAVAIMLILWVSGLASAFVDNIPLTTMMVRVVAALADGALNLPLAPLAWALSFGACLGGNGTLIGASANVVCAGVAEQHGYRFTFMQFFKIGFPVMIGNLLVASVYLLFCHCVFTWH